MCNEYTTRWIGKSERHLSILSRIFSQDLKPLGLLQSFFRSLDSLRINYAPAPFANRLELVPPNLRNRRLTAPALAPPLLEALPNDMRTTLLKTNRAKPPPTISLRCI